MKKTITENLKPAIFIVIVLILAAISAYPQRRLPGRVVEVIDGKTCVVELSTKKLKTVLQFIETPDPEQPLYNETKAHLEALVLDKNIEFIARGVVADKAIGQLFINGVDVSQQMLRDGAAWYSVAERSSQDTDDSLVYLNNEAQAKAEKRGVWGVLDLVPVWEFRAARIARQQRLEKDELMRTSRIRNDEEEQRRLQKKALRPVKQYDSEASLWAQTEEQQIPKGVTKVGGLLISHDPLGRFGFVGTPSLKLEILGNDKAPVVSIGMAYFYGEDGARGVKRAYIVGVESESKEISFLKNNNLVVTIDKQKIDLGKAKRAARASAFGVREFLTYNIKREVIEKIANAENTQVRVGVYDAKVNADIQQQLKNMLKATE